MLTIFFNTTLLGAQIVKPNTVICEIKCKDSTDNEVVIEVYSAVAGKVIQFNKKLVQKPELLTQKPLTDGWIAIIDPRGKGNMKLKVAHEKLSHLKSLEEYKSLRNV